MDDIYILGVGNNTAVYIELVEQCGYNLKGLFHYNNERTGEIYHGYRILGSYDDLFANESLKGMNFALSQGDNQIRGEVFNKILDKRGNIPTIISASAQVSRFAKLGQGVIVHMNTVVHPDVTIGNNTVLSYNVSVTHTSNIGSNCYLSFGAKIGAYVNIEDYVFVGISAIVISGKVERIGEYSYIGAGSVITKSVDSCSVLAGNPARVLKKVK